ncbi:MAG TPA: DEAD/DEAH box helicase, partial [Candidatus Methanoperedenaceae archaeon]|nr:DEAD/DEAH box helicase [Candidatus Methanoperedenaceae archaeon]
MESFRNLGISAQLLASIKDAKFEKPSEIQEKSIPPILAGNDVIAGSATGSGKTLAFGAGILQRCERGRGIQALVLTPTRELAEQVAKALTRFSKYKPLGIIAVYGGVGITPQISGLRTADVVVGTPGRILDHICRNTIRLGGVKTLVLDEADRMFD